MININHHEEWQKQSFKGFLLKCLLSIYQVEMCQLMECVLYFLQNHKNLEESLYPTSASSCCHFLHQELQISKTFISSSFMPTFLYKYFRTNYIRVPSFIYSSIFKKMLGYIYIYMNMIMCTWVRYPAVTRRSQIPRSCSYTGHPEMSAENWTQFFFMNNTSS